jgi:hypothetical protein
LEHIELEESPWQFAATLAEPQAGVFRVKIERLDQNEVEVNLWLAAYGFSPVDLQRVQADFQQRLDWLKMEKKEEGRLACRETR